MTYNVVSLFSGCGGMDLGLEGGFKFLGKKYQQLPFEIIQALDFDKNAVDIYNLNFSHKCEVRDILSTPNDYIKPHDVLIGGFPCQSFSIVAQNPKRLGYKDEKGKLFFEMCRILKDKKPKAFIAENVKGILSANKGEAFKLIIEEFEKSGYHVKYSLLNASHYGVPQKRERVFIVGFKDLKSYKSFTFPEPTTLLEPRKIKEILENEELIGDKYYFSEKAVLGMQQTKHSKTMNKGRDQDINSPCNTVGSHLAKVSLNSTDPVLKINGKYRMFTPKEVSRIQSFPEGFKLVDSKSINYKALGNAVPPVMMWHVSCQVNKALSKHDKCIDIKSQSENFVYLLKPAKTSL